MQRPLFVVVSSVALSVGLSLLVVTALRPAAGPPAVVEPETAALPADVVRRGDLDGLERALEELALEVSSLRRARATEASAPAVLAGGGGGEAEGGDAAPAGTRAAEPPPAAAPDALRRQVAAVLSEIEEEREAEEWAEELAERREEALAANEEYAEFDRELEPRLGELRDQIGLAGNEVRELRGMLAVQNERNRELTRVWSEGEADDEELERIYMENRAEHRAAVQALLGEERLDEYREFLREGGLGGRFAYFVGPWEDWGEDEER